ncbi:MAG: hypothetical protein IT324_12940 [Anaerolineae bacterium]|nr:hypothetical protein [Anaerolineae bacterium]
MNQPVSTLLADFRVLLYLFVGFRLVILTVFAPVEGLSAGVTAFGDYAYYYDLARLSDAGQLPYRDYWYEFPPVFPTLSLTIYKLLTPKDFTTYAVYLGLLMTAVDTVNLTLMRRIGARLYDDAAGLAIAWVYALLAVPLVFAFWTFEPLVLCAMLIALWGLTLPPLTSSPLRSDGEPGGSDSPLHAMERDRGGRPTLNLSPDQPQAERGRTQWILSALAVAFGSLTKFFPLVMLAPVWRFRPPREAIRYTLIAVGLTAVGLLAMLAAAGPFGVPSIMAQVNKASYQSIWALVDHNYRTGSFGLISDHFDPVKAYALLGNPPVIPWWLRTALFAGIGLVVYARTRRYDNRGLVAFVTLTMTLFFLWSQGWSPQWLVVLIPLILLNYPTRSGVLFSLLLAVDSFLEYPLSFSHNADPTGAIVVDQLPRFALTVLIHTVLLIALAVALYRRLRTPE